MRVINRSKFRRIRWGIQQTLGRQHEIKELNYPEEICSRKIKKKASFLHLKETQIWLSVQFYITKSLKVGARRELGKVFSLFLEFTSNQEFLELGFLLLKNTTEHICLEFQIVFHLSLQIFGILGKYWKVFSAYLFLKIRNSNIPNCIMQHLRVRTPIGTPSLSCGLTVTYRNGKR